MSIYGATEAAPLQLFVAERQAPRLRAVCLSVCIYTAVPCCTWAIARAPRDRSPVLQAKRRGWHYT